MSTLRSLFVLAVVPVLFAGCECGAPGTRCALNADCPTPGQPFCSPALDVCVSCLEDAHCADGSICTAQGTCEVGCRSEHDRCELPQYCLEGVGCVECGSDTQCGQGNVCAGNHCVPGCSVDNPTCPQGLVCDINSGRCVGCLTGADCPNPQLPVCHPTSQTCVECAGNGDCHDAARPVCDPASNGCVNCTGDANCQPGFVCTNNTCTAGCNANHPCPAGQQCNTQTGLCVACLNDSQCGGSTPRCDPGTNTCVACLPGASDNCPQGQYCRNDFVCEQGCKSGTDCPSGVCLGDHSCGGCTQDSQCAAGKVCSNGLCIDMCSATAPCGSGKDCCGGHCFDLANDVNNCGACGNACGAGQTCCNGTCSGLNTVDHCGACTTTCGTGEGCCTGTCTGLAGLNNCGACGVACGVDQFCDGATCRNVVFPEFCANRDVYAIYDAQPLDDAATNVLASTIQQYCSTQTQISYGPQTNAQWVDQTTGALLLGGGKTVVTAGGPFPNKPVKWLERTNMATKVYFATNAIDTYYFKKRSDDAIVVTRQDPYCSTASSRDVFLVEVSADPSSGTLALIAYGLCGGGYGTRSGAWFWANVMLPNRTSYPNSWYIYEWADGNANAQPDSVDTFTQLATGL